MPTVTGRMQGIAEMAASHVPYDSLTDAEVMLRAGTDDNAAYEYLVTKYHRPMIAFMYRMCHNQALAEELAQEVFLQGLSFAQDLCGGSQVHHMALSHSHEPGSKSCARPQG